MDLWGAGCVFFEIVALSLFPGTNELDQIKRIHKVLGTPSAELLAKFKRNGAAHVNFDFPEQKGIGLAELIPHASSECVDLMKKMLEYDPQDRMSAREGLQHAYFRDIRELEARRQQQQPQGGALRTATGTRTRAAAAKEAAGGRRRRRGGQHAVGETRGEQLLERRRVAGTTPPVAPGAAEHRCPRGGGGGGGGAARGRRSSGTAARGWRGRGAGGHWGTRERRQATDEPAESGGYRQGHRNQKQTHQYRPRGRNNA